MDPRLPYHVADVPDHCQVHGRKGNLDLGWDATDDEESIGYIRVIWWTKATPATCTEISVLRVEDMTKRFLLPCHQWRNLEQRAQRWTHFAGSKGSPLSLGPIPKLSARNIRHPITDPRERTPLDVANEGLGCCDNSKASSILPIVMVATVAHRWV